MNPRTTGILALVALLLGGFVYFYEIRGGERREVAEALAKQLFPEAEASALSWIELRTSDGSDARVERRDGVWRLTQPLDFLADGLVIDGLADALAGVSSAGVIEDAQAPEVYGLGDDAKWIRFGIGDQTHELRLGRDAPVGGSTYAAVGGNDAVYTVETFSIRPLGKTLDALREGRPLRFDRDAVDRIEVAWRGEGVVLEKDGDRWWLREPREERADEVTIDTLLSDLTFLDAEGFLDDADPAELGFADPDYRVRIRLGEDGAEHELVFGDPVSEGKTRALRGAGGALYAIDEQRYGDFPRRLVEFRYKQLADYLASDAESFELVLRQEDSEERLALRGELRDGTWTTSPEEMRAGAPARMISALSALRAKDIIADTMGPDERRALRLDPGNAALRIYGAEAAGAPLLAELRLGTIAASVLYAQVAGREAVYALESDVAEDVPVSLEAFRNRFVSNADPEETDSSAAGALEEPLSATD